KASAVNTVNKGSLEITHSYKDEPLANIKFSIYKFANFDENGGFVVTDDFKKYPIDFDKLEDKSDWYLLYDTLATYAKVDNIPTLKENKTDYRGKVNFNDLDLGVYLVTLETLTKDGFKYEGKPFLVSIPTKSDGKDIYNVNVYTKVEKTSIGDPGLFVQKKWVNDIKENRPKWIKVSLYRNDVFYDSAILSDENNWQHKWDGLEDGVDWRIVEEVPNGYTVSYEKYGGVIIVTNTGTASTGGGSTGGGSTGDGSQSGTGTLPQTGSTLLELTYIYILAVIFIVSGCFLIRSKKA
ncbi:MAG: Cna B-type domain-containing protein, partial [Clostridium sp.]